jgi:hypothetical protein
MHPNCVDFDVRTATFQLRRLLAVRLTPTLLGLPPSRRPSQRHPADMHRRPPASTGVVNAGMPGRGQPMATPDTGTAR